MKPITPERLREVLAYSPETGVFTWRVATNWRIEPGRVAGTLDRKGYRRITVDGQIHKAHRLAWIYVTGRQPVGQVDHINGQKGDNRFDNLRLATNAENGRNRGANSNSTTGLKGVTWREDLQRFRAQIMVDGKKRYLGHFRTSEEAHAAYLSAARKMHGDFALRRGIEIATGGEK